MQAEFSVSKDILEDLQVEYTRLFINGVPHVVAPPYASVYLDKTLRGKYSDKILTYYRSLGYTLAENADLPDSLIHQLEFLSFLAEDNNQPGEEEFLACFFLPWFSIFASKVKEEAQHPLYRTIISFIDFFAKEDMGHGVQHPEASFFLQSASLAAVALPLSGAIASESGVTPSPLKAKGSLQDETVVGGVCEMCFWRCQLVGKTRGDRLVKLERNPKSIDNGSAICARDNGGNQLLYNPDRLKYPLKNVGERGKPKWKRISW